MMKKTGLLIIIFCFSLLSLHSQVITPGKTAKDTVSEIINISNEVNPELGGQSGEGIYLSTRTIDVQHTVVKTNTKVELHSGHIIRLSKGSKVEKDATLYAIIDKSLLKSTGENTKKSLLQSQGDNSSSNELLTEETFSVYPNPTNGMINISINNGMPYTYVIISADGSNVAEKENCSNASSVDLSKYPSGIYFILIQFPDGKSVQKKIMKM